MVYDAKTKTRPEAEASAGLSSLHKLLMVVAMFGVIVMLVDNSYLRTRLAAVHFASPPPSPPPHPSPSPPPPHPSPPPPERPPPPPEPSPPPPTPEPFPPPPKPGPSPPRPTPEESPLPQAPEESNDSMPASAVEVFPMRSATPEAPLREVQAPTSADRPPPKFHVAQQDVHGDEVSLQVEITSETDADLSKMVLRWQVSSETALLQPRAQIKSEGSIGSMQVEVTFVAAESGVHWVSCRLEYWDRADPLRDPNFGKIWSEEGLPNPEFLGWVLPGAPAAVHVPAFPPRDRPVCEGTEQGGVWRVLDNAADRARGPQARFKAQGEGMGQRSCAHCLSKKLHKPQEEDCKMLEQGPRTQHSSEEGGLHFFDGQHCKYCQYSQAEGAQCLAKYRLTIVGDSVGMDMCNQMRCSLAAATGDSSCKVSYDVRGCSFLNPTRKPWECDKGGPQGEIVDGYTQGDLSSVNCVSWDQFAGGVYASRAIGTANVREGGDLAMMEERMRRYRLWAKRKTNYTADVLRMRPPGEGEGERPEDPEGLEEREDGVQDVLVIGAGAHDATYEAMHPKHFEGNIKSTLDKVLEQSFKAGFDRVIWQLGAAIHKSAAALADCRTSEPFFGSCLQQNHWGLTAPRMNWMNDLTVAHLREKWSTAPKRVEILDAFQLSDAREEASAHRDIIHYCPVVYNAINHMLLHQLCGC